MIKIEKGNVTGLQEAIRELNKIDKGIVRQLRADMKSALASDAKELASSVDLKAPLRGFNHTGRTRWTGTKGTVSVTPSRIRKGKDIHPIVTIKLTGKDNGAGFDIAEKAGMRNLRWSVDRSRKAPRRGTEFSRSHSRSQGQKFVKSLSAVAPFKFQGGRFAYGKFLAQRKDINKKAVKVIDKFAKKFNKKVSR